MSAYSGWPLQQSLFTALDGDAVLSQVITGVHSFVPERTAFPYIVLGDFLGRDYDTKTENGSEMAFDVDVYSRGRSTKETHQILGHVHRILHQADLSVSGHKLANLRWDGFSTIRKERTDNNITFHGIMRFRAKTQEDAPPIGWETYDTLTWENWNTDNWEDLTD